jgi:hypothetical protein
MQDASADICGVFYRFPSYNYFPSAVNYWKAEKNESEYRFTSGGTGHWTSSHSYVYYEAPMRYGRGQRLFCRRFSMHFSADGRRLARKRWPWPEAPGWSDSKIRSGT